jgi:hypothetical protein
MPIVGLAYGYKVVEPEIHHYCLYVPGSKEDLRQNVRKD